MDSLQEPLTHFLSKQKPTTSLRPLRATVSISAIVLQPSHAEDLLPVRTRLHPVIRLLRSVPKAGTLGVEVLPALCSAPYGVVAAAEIFEADRAVALYESAVVGVV